jgi:tetratricopeptide (TPR) repeat protein
MLAGEPGIGKTRLLHEGALLAEAAGWTVLRGGCQRRSGQEPFAPFASALASSLVTRSRSQQRLALQGCAWLVRLLPELSGAALVPAPEWALPPDQERRLMFAAVARFLGNVAGSAGTLLLLDDLQWAGSDALDLLASLLHTGAERPLRVLGAYRSTEVFGQHPLAVTLADFARDGLATEMVLGPLATEEATELLDALLPLAVETGREPSATPARLAHVLRRTGGVPFFLVSCAQDVWTRAEQASETGDDIPWNVAQTVGQRVTALPRRARDLLAVAAVAGRVTPSNVLLTVAQRLGQSRWQAMDALEACCRARLLLEQEGATYTFTHDLIHEVVVAHLSAVRQVALHEEIAHALEHAPGSPPIEQLAYHYAQSSNQEKAVLYLRQAGEHAWALHANAEAAAHYQELVTRLEALGHTLDAACAREQLGDVLIILGRYDEALTELEQAAEAHRTRGDVDRAAYTLGRIAFAHARGGTAWQWLTKDEPLGEAERLAAAAGQASRGVAWLYASLATALNNAGRYAEELDAARRSAELACAVGDEAVLVLAMVTQGLALDGLGRRDEARTAFEEAVVLAERLGDLGQLARALMNLGSLCDAQGDFAAAQVWYERAEQAAERFGDPPLTALVLSSWAFSAYSSGSWPLAQHLAERAAAVHTVERSWTSPHIYITQAQLAMATGNWEVAATALQAADRLARVTRHTAALRAAQELYAEHELLESRPDAARERLAQLVEQPDQLDSGDAIALSLLAWAYCDAGESDRAAELSRRAVALARQREQCIELVDALRIAALVDIRIGPRQEASVYLEEAISRSQAMPYPYAEAKALYVYGLLHQESGDAARSRDCLEAALALCGRLGEGLYRPVIEQALAEL